MFNIHNYTNKKEYYIFSKKVPIFATLIIEKKNSLGFMGTL